MSPSDHHTEYLSRAVADLTPEGRERVDELLDQLAEAAGGTRVAYAFRRGPETRRLTRAALPSRPKRSRGGCSQSRSSTSLRVGFMTIRDQEHLDDVANWANAVLALLEDEAEASESA